MNFEISLINSLEIIKIVTKLIKIKLTTLTKICSYELHEMSSNTHNKQLLRYDPNHSINKQNKFKILNSEVFLNEQNSLPVLKITNKY